MRDVLSARRCRRMASMTAEEVLESLDRHFLAGCPALSAGQLREHETAGSPEHFSLAATLD
jgi:hypothetical protein